MYFKSTHGSHASSTGPRAESATGAATGAGGFRFMFPGAALAPAQPGTVARLDRLGEQMVTGRLADAAQESRHPPILTYLGQFIDHDVTAGTDTDPRMGSATAPDFEPLSRAEAAAGMDNARTGRLDLDSLYGGTPTDAFDAKLTGLMRHPTFPGKMRVAFPDAVAGAVVPLPEDGASDLLRLGFLVDRGDLTEAELRALPDPRRRHFFHSDDQGAPGDLNRHRAIIGDGRNDENLFVAQLQLAFLRFHNRVVDTCTDQAVIGAGSDALFDWARRHVRWTYQWLVVNSYLRALTDPAVLDWVIADGASLYTAMPDPARDGDRLPLPIEFSAAAFRFGHSMIRDSYDWNRFFGREVEGDPNFQERALLGDLFDFTGNVTLPMKGFSPRQLPSNWPAEWDRLAMVDLTRPDRSARRIDTLLAPELEHLRPEAGAEMKRKIANLARLNLRRGYLLNLPTGQGCVAAVADRTGIELAPLSEAELKGGPLGPVLEETGLTGQTPLWAYVLREAEVRAGGERLGPLGSLIVASTLVGLLVADRSSYWHAIGAGGGRWSPADGARPNGEPVTSLPALLRAALVLEA